MTDPRMARRVGSKLLKIREKYEADAMAFERHWESSFINLIRQNMQNLSEAAFRDRLIAMANDQREKVVQGLIFGMLTDIENANKYFEYLGEVATDNWYSALCNMNMILFEFFNKMNDSAKNQILLFFRLAIRANVAKIDNVLMNYVRYATDGSDFNSRIRLARGIAEMLSDKIGKEWILSIKNLSLLMPVLLMTFTRLAVDLPQSAANESTRNLLLNCASYIFVRRLSDCIQLGRDLLLVLMKVSRTPQFNPIWKDFIKNPSAFQGIFKNVEDLFCRPPLASLLSQKVSIPIQRQLEFLLISLRNGTHEKHLEWFNEWNLRASDSSALRADILRMIIGFPTDKYNMEMKMIVAHSLISQCPHGPEMQWAKLVLWWDWFGYQPGESIHSVETSHNVLRYALNIQPAMANTWLEYAMRQMNQLHPSLSSFFRQSFNTAYRSLSERQSSQFVSSVLESARLDSAIRELVRNELAGKPSNCNPNSISDRRGSIARDIRQKEYTKSSIPSTSQSNTTLKPLNNVSKTTVSQPSSSSRGGKNTNGDTVAPSCTRTCVPSTSSIPSSSSVSNRIEKKPKKKSITNSNNEIEGAYKELKGELKIIAAEIKSLFADEKSDVGERCDALQKAMKYVQDNEEVQEDDSQLEHLGHLIGSLLRPLVPIEGTNLLPNINIDKIDSDTLTECFSGPLYVVFKALSYPDSRTAIESIISFMRERDNAVTYLLLFFLKVYAEDSNLPSASYENVSVHFDHTLDQRLEEDLDLMAKDDRRLFSFVLPFVFKTFPNVACTSVGVYRVICHYSDNDILNDLIGAVYREDLTLFRKDGFNGIIQSSLEWESIPEMILWQLVGADGVTAEWLYPLYTRISSTKNSVAATQLLILLKRQEPNTQLVRSVMSRPLTNDDPFTVNALKVMIEDEESCQRTADIVSSILKKQMSSGEILVSSLNNKGGTKKNNSKLSMEHILFHLSELSSRCLVKEKRMTEAFLTRESFRDALQATRKNDKTSVLYSKFEKLFSFVEMLDEQRNSSRSLRGNRGNNRSNKRDTTITIEDEPKKKKRNIITIDSDDSD